MKRNIKFRQIWKLSLVLAAVAAWVIVPFLIQNKVEASGDVPVSTLSASLASPSGSINPHGLAVYDVYSGGNRELDVEIEDVNLAAGTVLTAYLNGNSLGQATVGTDFRAKLRLRTQDGQTVPVVESGMTAEYRDGATVLVSGVFGGGNPTPSPSVSPTSSPSPSPSVSPTSSPSPSPSPTGTPNGSEIYAILTGATIDGALPRGYAEYEVEGTNREFEVRVRQVNLPVGTSLAVFVDNVAVGNLVLQSGGEARFEVESANGQPVPTVNAGSLVEVKNAGATILSGTFSGSGSPTPTPAGTPQGRYFEGHLNGAGVTPPVTTNAIGEIKILLNADETQATISGEFNRFSSSQTSARILVTVAATTSVVADLGTVASPEGEGSFAPATIAVNAQQVQQLRTGMWFAVIGSANNPNGEIQGTILSDSHGADFDGDGSNDLAVFRPSTGTWYSQNSQGFTAQNFGSASDVPVSADYDGDGKTDKAVFRSVNGFGVWEISRSADGGVTSTQFGFGTDKPLRGDFDGDGRNDLAVYRPSTGVWYVMKSNNTGFIIVRFGSTEDIPLSTDIDGDGKSDVTVFRPSTGVWYSIRSSNGSIRIDKFGQTGDIPLRGDFDGDGRDDLSIYRPSTGVWYIWNSGNNGFDIRQFGMGDDIPVAGNYDGDSKTDIAVFRPSTGIWYIWRSIDGTYDYRQFGLNGDVPVGK